MAVVPHHFCGGFNVTTADHSDISKPNLFTGIPGYENRTDIVNRSNRTRWVERDELTTDFHSPRVGNDVARFQFLRDRLRCDTELCDPLAIGLDVDGLSSITPEGDLRNILDEQ
jgi:hypothetical protein